MPKATKAAAGKATKKAVPARSAAGKGAGAAATKASAPKRAAKATTPARRGVGSVGASGPTRAAGTKATSKKVTAAHKANIETLFGLTNKAFEGVEKLVELNLQVAKTALGEAAETTKAALSAKDAHELLALHAALLQPAAEKAAAYSRHLYDIAAATNAEVGKVAEATASEAQRKFVAAVDVAVKNAPAGSENAVALVKSAVAAANNALESVTKAAKQAQDVAEANFQALNSSAVKASQAAAAKTRRNSPPNCVWPIGVHVVAPTSQIESATPMRLS